MKSKNHFLVSIFFVTCTMQCVSDKSSLSKEQYAAAIDVSEAALQNLTDTAVDISSEELEEIRDYVTRTVAVLKQNKFKSFDSAAAAQIIEPALVVALKQEHMDDEWVLKVLKVQFIELKKLLVHRKNIGLPLLHNGKKLNTAQFIQRYVDGLIKLINHHLIAHHRKHLKKLEDI